MASTSEWNWQSAELRNGVLVFDSADGIEHGLRDGFFFVTQPAELRIDHLDRFAREWHLPEDPLAPQAYRGFARLTGDKLEPPSAWLGYTNHKADQSEQFLLERNWWASVYPPEVLEQTEALKRFTNEVLCAVLPHLDIPAELWDRATGGLASRNGYYALLFNHFRHYQRRRGLAKHRDTGWLSVVRSTEAGLEVERDGEWYAINPVPGKFIVNFGVLMDILTRRSQTPVAARPHRVVEQPETRQDDRLSYVMFTDNRIDLWVSEGHFEYEPGVGLIPLGSLVDFYTAYLADTFDPEGSGVY